MEKMLVWAAATSLVINFNLFVVNEDNLGWKLFQKDFLVNCDKLRNSNGNIMVKIW